MHWRNRIVGQGAEPPDQLLANPRNWRTHPAAQQEALAGSLAEVGWVQQVIVNRRTGRLLDGHLRVTLADRNGEAAVPVLYVDLEEAEEALVLATLDPIAGLATADAAKLDELLREVSTGVPALQTMLADLAAQHGLDYAGGARDPADAGLADDPGAEPDRADELLAKWQTAPGQLWEIPSRTLPGHAHRLLCGDSTSAEDVRRLMRGERAVLFATDPPYAVAYDGTNHPHKWGDPDNNKDWSDSYRDWDKIGDPEALYAAFMAVARAEAIAQDAAWYCWHAGVRAALVQAAFERNGAFVHQQIIWVKDRPILNRSWYMWQHEPCFFGWVRPHKPKRVSDDHPRSVWQVATIKPGVHTDHPTAKPVEIFAIPIAQHTAPGDLCYEPFAGSGTQFVAAEQAGRRCYGLEREPRYVAVILERLAGLGLAPRRAET
jgi:DNA modification methylase